MIRALTLAPWQCCVPSDADPTGDAADTGDDGAEGPEADEGILPDDEAKADAGDDDDDGGEGVQARSADPEAAAAPKKPKTKGERIYAAAAKWIGTHYKWGGGNCRGPTNGGFDCSGKNYPDSIRRGDARSVALGGPS